MQLSHVRTRLAAACLIGAALPSVAGLAFSQQATPISARSLPLVTLDLDGTYSMGPGEPSRAAVGTAITLDGLESLGFLIPVEPVTGTRWYSRAVKGAGGTGGESEIMTSFQFSYCTTALDASLGGPGAALTIAFHQDYTGPSGGIESPPTGMTLATYELSGMPGSFDGSAACYSVLVQTATPVGGGFQGGQALPDGPLGWSFEFVDQVPGGTTAATRPLLSCSGSCTGSGYGVETYTSSGGFQGTPFGSASVQSLPMQIREAVQVIASSVVENGTGQNPVILSAVSGPVLGGGWSVALDCTGAAPGKPAVFKLDFAPPATPSSSPLGELLISSGPSPFFVLPHGGGVATLGPIPLPLDLSFLNVGYRLQGLCGDDPSGYLSNALDQIVGSH